MRKFFQFLGVLIVCSFASQVSAAVLYLKNGDELECQSFKRKSGSVQVIVNRDTVLEFTDEEVDFTKSTKPGKKTKLHATPAPRKVAKAMPAAKPSAGVSDIPRIDGVFYGIPVPPGSVGCTPQLKEELLSRVRNYSRAAEKGDWKEWGKHALAQQAKKTEQVLAGLSKAELEKRREGLRSLGVKNYQPQGCQVSEKDATAVMAGRAGTTGNGKPESSHVTVLFRQESDGWKVQSTVWNRSLQ